jgi:DNA adenine methylase
MINHPEAIATAYKKLWQSQQGKEREFYDSVRIRFNQTQRADYLLYLLARCVKAAVRYNSNGEFNQSPDNRRKGAQPSTMLSQIVGASNLLKGRTSLATRDYRDVVNDASVADLVYLDPPYQGVTAGRDRRYSQSLSYDNFVDSLEELNRNKISFIVSYDGRTGAKKFGKRLPENLRLTHIEIKAGRSSQATLLGRNEDTFESLYLAPALIERIGKPFADLEAQATLFPDSANAETIARVPEALEGRNEQTA